MRRTRIVITRTREYSDTQPAIGVLEIDESIARVIADLLLAGYRFELNGTLLCTGSNQVELKRAWFEAVPAVVGLLPADDCTSVIDVTMTGVGPRATGRGAPVTKGRA